ncbi:hypothetical protein K461DRAFT_282471 [Myriangium duriaei CBS 260.36]|uniref:Uncharacterized protein n=1 Tax=Myriangium duriaei CBS 260.36 TaxID=1168546 RepID=A0A9P4MDL2_9PEZI|nr:hypothetical protein K461DRAFT_282471 [Myriangium duriaei CBS 260.36]
MHFTKQLLLACLAVASLTAAMPQSVRKHNPRTNSVPNIAQADYHHQPSHKHNPGINSLPDMAQGGSHHQPTALPTYHKNGRAEASNHLTKRNLFGDVFGKWWEWFKDV